MGSVRQVVCHKTKPFAATVSLDSYLRLYDLDTAKLLNQVNLKVQLNCILMRSNFGEEETKPKIEKSAELGDSDVECVTLSDDELDEIFDNMESVKDIDEEPSSKKQKIIE